MRADCRNWSRSGSGACFQSPFTFYRGAAAIMAADLAATPTTGPRVQACGDAHLLNFGGFAAPERWIVFDISDLDETLPAPWEWDVERLAASLVTAGRDVGLSNTDASRAATAAVRSYRENTIDYAGMRALDVWCDDIDVARFINETATSGVKRSASSSPRTACPRAPATGIPPEEMRGKP